MQTNHQDIYAILGIEKGNEQLYKDIGTFIFKETAQMMKNPTSLIVKLKGIGNWHLRKKRMEILVNEWTDRSVPLIKEDFITESSYQVHLDKQIQYINFQERLREYDKYLEIKREVRAKRYLTQTLLVPKDNTEKFKSE
jgi:phosphoglycerate-specific signal transduction histidine kinase